MHTYPKHVTANGTVHCVANGCSTAASAGQGSALAEGGVPRFAVFGSDLCRWHEGQLARALRELATDLRTVRAAVLQAPGRDDSARGRSSTVSDVSAMWNPAASAVAFEIEDWTGFVVRTVVKERPLGEGQSHGTLADADAPVALVALSTWHSSWLARYPDLGPDLLSSALAHRRAVVKAVGSASVQRVTTPLRCQEVIRDTDAGPILCEAVMVGVLRNRGDSRPSTILCSTNPNHKQLSRDEWMQAARPFMEATYGTAYVEATYD